MSCGIYKFTNKINNKVYIGQSTYIEKRYREHFYDCERLTSDRHKSTYFHKALQKYGKDNFNFEIIELCEENQLNEREKYWIEYYHSFQNGYNLTYGGDGRSTRKYDSKLILELYEKYKSTRKVATILKCDKTTISRRLKENNIQLFSQAEILSKLVLIKYNNQDYIFNTLGEAAQWIIDNRITKSTNLESVKHILGRCIRNNKKYLKMEVIYYERSK